MPKKAIGGRSRDLERELTIRDTQTNRKGSGGIADHRKAIVGTEITNGSG